MLKKGLDIVLYFFLGMAIVVALCYKYRQHKKYLKNQKNMILIEGGTYSLGVPIEPPLSDLKSEADVELGMGFAVSVSPLEEKIDDFYLDAFEVTNREYALFRNFVNHCRRTSAGRNFLRYFEHPLTPPDHDYAPNFQKDAKFSEDKQPVVGVNWFDAYTFSQFLGYRLPSAAEWEYACSNGGKTTYPWGDQFIENVAIIDNADHLVPVPGSEQLYKGGKTLDYDLFHMVGNVAEWTSAIVKTKDGAFISVVKGGSCYDSPGSVQGMCYYLKVQDAKFKSINNGIRLASSNSFSRKVLGIFEVDELLKARGRPGGESTNTFAFYNFYLQTIKRIREERELKHSRSIEISGGTLTIGSPEENPVLALIRESKSADFMLKKVLAHQEKRVELAAFYIDPIEVTNDQYASFLADSLVQKNFYGHPQEPANKDYTPANWDNSDFIKPGQPVTGIDWWDAYAYANWAGKRLPTKEEWEAAARFDNPDFFPWGNSFVAGHSASAEMILNAPPLVCSFSNDMTKMHLCDMSGCVSEWVASKVDTEDKNTLENMYLMGGNYQRKGGLHGPLFLSNKASIHMRDNAVGFRCAMTKK